jgi:hypothetical protein
MLLLIGCSSARIYSDQVKDVDFSKYHTYAWLPSKKDTTKKVLYKSDIVIQNVQKAATAELQKRGFKTQPKKPDLLVLLHLTYEEINDTQTTPLYSTYDYYYPDVLATPNGLVYYYNYNTVTHISGYEQQQINYTQGTVVVDVIDAKTKSLIWRGWSERPVYPETASQELSSDVEKIFKKFPVKEMKKK